MKTKSKIKSKERKKDWNRICNIGIIGILILLTNVGMASADTNVAFGKSVSITTNGAEDSRECPGHLPSDITDGSLYYLPSSLCQEDGVVGYVNDDYNQLMVINVNINLNGIYRINKIRYNMGNVLKAEAWNADIMESPFGRTVTNPGSSYTGVWTEQTGDIIASEVNIKFEKTRTTDVTDWLFIGEIEIYGVPTTESSITVTSPNGGENWQSGTVQTIKWSYTGNPGPKIKIELLKSGVAKTIKSSVPIGSGSYSWKIPNNQKLGTDYKIRITNTIKPTYADMSNENFAIVGPTPFSISGRVTTGDGNGIEGVKMTFVRVSGIKIKIPVTVKTDANGYWSQKGFMSGTTYRVMPNNPILTNKDYIFAPYYLDFSSEKTDLNFIGIPTIRGIDISHWNGIIDWEKVRSDEANYKFAYVKATEGINYPDSYIEYFKTNMVGGNDATGILKGAYHFARPVLNKKGADEANYFIKVAKEYLKDGYLRPMLDLENFKNENPCKMGKEKLSKWVNEWIDTVKEETGISPILYVNSYYAKCLDDSVKANSELWIASPGISGRPSSYPFPPDIGTWNDWAIWQYSWTGKVDGISEPKKGVDSDILNGKYDLNHFVIKGSKIN